MTAPGWAPPERVFHERARAELQAGIGGEEFTVVMANTHREDALIVAEKIRAAVEEAVIPLEDAPLRMTVSIGAVAYPEDTGSARELLHLADAALYRAKAAGRNRVCVSDTVDSVRIAGRDRRRPDPSSEEDSDVRGADRPPQ